MLELMCHTDQLRAAEVENTVATQLILGSVGSYHNNHSIYSMRVYIPYTAYGYGSTTSTQHEDMNTQHMILEAQHAQHAACHSKHTATADSAWSEQPCTQAPHEDTHLHTIIPAHSTSSIQLDAASKLQRSIMYKLIMSL